MTFDTASLSDGDGQSGINSAVIWADDPEKAYFRDMMNERRNNRAAEGLNTDDSLIGDSTIADLMEDQTIHTYDPPAVPLVGSGLSYTEEDTIDRIEPDDAKSAKLWFAGRRRQKQRQEEMKAAQHLQAQRDSPHSMMTSQNSNLPQPYAKKSSRQHRNAPSGRRAGNNTHANMVQSPVSALSPTAAADRAPPQGQHARPTDNLNAAAAVAAGVEVPGFIFVTSGHPSAIQTKESPEKGKKPKKERISKKKPAANPSTQEVEAKPKSSSAAADPSRSGRSRRSRAFYGKIALVILMLALVVAIVMLALVFRQRRTNEKIRAEQSQAVPTFPPAFDFNFGSDDNDEGIPSTSAPSITENAGSLPPYTQAPIGVQPLGPTASPTTRMPVTSPTNAPITQSPTIKPTRDPTKRPTSQPTRNPTSPPSQNPTSEPTRNPTRNPTSSPTKRPSAAPNTNRPTAGDFLQDFLDALSILSPETSIELSNPNSPQSKALDWLLLDNELSNVAIARTVNARSNTLFGRALQRWILATFYFSTDGDNWIDNSSWLTSANECGWYGITCDMTSRVDDIGLKDNFLNGTLPMEIFLLSESLTTIVLNGNSLFGSLPEEYGALYKLSRFQLTANNLSGTVPTEFGRLASVGFVALGRNNFNGKLPIELGLLKALRTLDFAQNSFDGTIPSEYGTLNDLEFLSLSENNISGQVPSELGRLARLDQLILRKNDITGVMPDEICTLDLAALKADCSEVTCNCCTECCTDESGACVFRTPSPTFPPTASPTAGPTTSSPTKAPLPDATPAPSTVASKSPTNVPTRSPTRNPTKSPTGKPTIVMTRSPTSSPTKSPTSRPTTSPTKVPTRPPTKSPTQSPTPCTGTIRTDSVCYLNGNDITIEFDNCNPREDDWVGVYPANSDPNNLGDPIEWVWTCGDKICRGEVVNGRIVFPEARGIGNFKAFLVRRNSGGPYKAYGESAQFRIGNSC